jgi:hypothetical protein
VHLRDPMGRNVAWRQRAPTGARPTTTWRQARVRDPHIIAVLDTPPGAYQVVVGLYNEADGSRSLPGQ